MSIFDKLFGSDKNPSTLRGFIDYGMPKNDGSHDHRYNKGKDRTPAQKRSDEEKKK